MRRIIAITCVALTLVGLGCGEDEVVFPHLFVSLSAEPLTNGGRVDKVTLIFRKVENGAAGLFEGGRKVDHRVDRSLPPTVDLSQSPFVLSLQPGALIKGPALLIVLGWADGVMVASASASVNIDEKHQVEIRLLLTPKGCDVDGDGIKACQAAGCCDAGEALLGDCDDQNSAVGPLVTAPICKPCDAPADLDCDGKAEPCEDADEDGFADCDTLADCDPQNGAVNVGADEVCDGLDNNCNGQTDELFTDLDQDSKADCIDEDIDGDGDPNVTDCAPENPDIHALAAEVCDDQLDNDCDGKTDETLGCGEWIGDWDGDGKVGADDCNETDSRVHVGSEWTLCCTAADIDGLSAEDVMMACDFDCDGQASLCADDADGDGVEDLADCAPNDATHYPGAPDKCGDGADQDCSGGDADCDGLVDEDNDGFAPPTDCNDADPEINPYAPELCDGVDNDCNGFVDDGNPGGGAQCANPNQDGLCGQPESQGIQVCGHGLNYAPDFALDQAGGEPVAVVCLMYYLPPPLETACDEVDEDCDGAVDEDFDWVEQHDAGMTLKKGADCGAGVCGGKVVCAPEGVETASELWCDGLANQIEEKDGCLESGVCCDGLDNDCDGTVDGHEVDAATTECGTLGVCKAGLAQVVASCQLGQVACDYSGVAGFQAEETLCDGLDNDCDGLIDENLKWQQPGAGLLELGATCNGVGKCGIGKVECGTDGQTTCSTMPGGTKDQSVDEQCDNQDHDCDGKNFDVAWKDENLGPEAPVSAFGEPCDAPGACGAGLVECSADKQPVCSSGPGGSENEASAAEPCDNLDNDCDGETDEETPGKGDDCEAGEGACGVAGKLGCAQGQKSTQCVHPETNEPLVGLAAGEPCDDGNLCTVGDACTGGALSACVGNPYLCDDGRPCTVDECVGDELCTNVPADGWCFVDALCTLDAALNPVNSCLVCDASAPTVWTPLALGAECSDGNDCTDGDACDGAGSCQGEGTVCDDGDPCTLDKCVVQGDVDTCTVGGVQPGKCLIDAVCWSFGELNPENPCEVCSDNTDTGWTEQGEIGCNDGDPCTGNDKCKLGICQGVVVNCDDGNQCTVDSCNAQGKCQHVGELGAQCDDGDTCTFPDLCQKDGCVSGKEVVCTDNNPCTTDSCGKDGCKFVLGDNNPCDDGDTCTTADVCLGGACMPGLPKCQDNEVCTDDSCDDGVCTHAPNALPCDDDQPCTVNDLCVGGVCTMGMPMDCEDGNECTQNTCAGGVCVKAFTNLPCDDKDKCTTGDVCAGGECTAQVVECMQDDDTCTLAVCNPKDGKCDVKKFDDDEPCDDGDVCTENDVCKKMAKCQGTQIAGCMP